MATTKTSSSKKTSPKKRTTKKTSTTATVSKTTAKKTNKAKVERNRFGRHAGTQGYAIEQLLIDAKPKAVDAATLAETTELPMRRIHQHCSWLVRTGVCEKTTKGYKLLK